MRPLRALGIYVVVVFLGGALLAPWLYAAVQATAAHSDGLRSLSQAPFHRYVNRCLLGLALLGLWPLARALGLRRWADLGWTRPAGQWAHLGRGLALGFGSLALVALLALAAGARSWAGDRPWADLGRHVLNAGLAALVVAVLEETLFRGALFGAVRRAHGWRLALIVSSLVYAWVHFLQRVPRPDTVDWATGLVTLGRMLRGFVDLEALVPGFFNLALAGALLALVYHRTGTLYFSVGLHAGWIFWLKSYGYLTQAGPGVSGAWWGSAKLIDGWAATAVLAATMALCVRPSRPCVPAP